MTRNCVYRKIRASVFKGLRDNCREHIITNTFADKLIHETNNPKIINFLLLPLKLVLKFSTTSMRP